MLSPLDLLAVSLAWADPLAGMYFGCHRFSPALPSWVVGMPTVQVLKVNFVAIFDLKSLGGLCLVSLRLFCQC